MAVRKNSKKKLASKMETELLTRLREELPGVEIKGNDRSTLKYGKDIDILIPSKKIAIEFNGDLWHSDAFIKLNTPQATAKQYHELKRKELAEKGITLLFVWEYYWIVDKDSIVKQLVADIKSSGKKVHPMFKITTGPMNDWYVIEDIYDAEERKKPTYKIDDTSVAAKISSPAEYYVMEYIKTKNSLWKFWMGVNRIMNDYGLKRVDVQNAVVSLKEKGVIRYLGDDCFMLDPKYRTTTAKIRRKQSKEFPSAATKKEMKKLYKV